MYRDLLSGYRGHYNPVSPPARWTESIMNQRWEFIKEGFKRKIQKKHAFDQVKSRVKVKKKDTHFRPRKNKILFC